MHSTSLKTPDGTVQWTFHYDNSLTGGVDINDMRDPDDLKHLNVPMEVLLEFVGQRLTSERIAHIEGQNGMDYLLKDTVLR